MPATAISLPSDSNGEILDHSEVLDFLRRLASMLAGGRNAQMLLQAAETIETLTSRAVSAEQLVGELRQHHGHSLEPTGIADLAENLTAAMESLKSEYAASKEQAEAEIAALKAQLLENNQRHEQDRAAMADQALRLQAIAENAETRLAELVAREEQRSLEATWDDSVVVVPLESLQLARDQFDCLAKAFAKNGDVISLTICEIGACAIEKALAGDTGDKK